MAANRPRRLRRSDPAGPGIRRTRRGRGFGYVGPTGGAVTAEDRERIEALVLPPAWKDVWISPYPNGHIQAIGTDAAGRRQYRYHDVWREQKDRDKFDRMLRLADALPGANRKALADLAGTDARERALGAAFRILSRAAPRVGSETYLETAGTRGLTTLLCSHISVEGDLVTIGFRGKGGQRWEAVIDDAPLAPVLAELASRSPRARLLAWPRDRGWRPASAHDVNDYIGELTGGEFTAKDFRTLKGTLVAAESLRESLVAERKRADADGRLGEPRSETVANRAEREAIRAAARDLGNTVAVARASYVDPRVLEAYRGGRVLPSASGLSREAALVQLLKR